MPQTRLAGFVIVLISTVLWSTAGLFVQMARLDTWSIIAWRSLFTVLSLSLFWLFVTSNKASVLRQVVSPSGVAATALAAVSAISYVVSLQLTSVANVMTVYAALPFIATAIAFFALGERVTARFVVCGLLAFVGIVTMSQAAIDLTDMVGIGAAFLMTAGFAGSMVQAKRYPYLDMTLITVASAAICGVIALPLMETFTPGLTQLLACALLGVLTTGLANVLSLVGGRLIGSGEAGFLLLLDVVLGPLWVWLAFDERVGPAALVGGGIVMAAVGWYLLQPTKTEALSISAQS
jgi:drug/metabolite transporter (DMT)-like permease